MMWRVTAAGVVLVLAGCVLDRAGVQETGQGGNGAGAGGSGGAGEGGEAGMGGTAPTCGDGIINQPEETCDEGGQNSPNCDFDCTAPLCGDGIHNTNAGEGCDDGNNIDGDGCSSTCISEDCGDGVVNTGEECDDGNRNDNDDCRNNCNLSRCGDGALHNEGSGTEQCDDNNNDLDDSCPSGPMGTCQNAFCGDGFVEAGVEDCDDGNTEEHDDCLSTCVVASCGDGFIHSIPAVTESCDDGNAADSDGCDVACAREPGACCVGEGPGSCSVGPFTIGMGGIAHAIPDDGDPGNVACETFTFSQTGCGDIADVNVQLGIDHTWVGDLVVTIEGPGSVVQTLMDQSGFGDSSNISSAFPVTFDDEAMTSANDMGAGINGNAVVCQATNSPCDYMPNPGNLAAYDGTAATGAWTVCVGDDNPNDTGTLESVQITFLTQ